MRQTQSQHKDFLHSFMKQQGGGSLDQNEIIVNSAFFIIAGTEMVVRFLGGVFNQLLRPEDKYVMDKMV